MRPSFGNGARMIHSSPGRCSARVAWRGSSEFGSTRAATSTSWRISPACGIQPAFARGRYAISPDIPIVLRGALLFRRLAPRSGPDRGQPGRRDRPRDARGARQERRAKAEEPRDQKAEGPAAFRRRSQSLRRLSSPRPEGSTPRQSQQSPPGSSAAVRPPAASPAASPRTSGDTLCQALPRRMSSGATWSVLAAPGPAS